MTESTESHSSNDIEDAAEVLSLQEAEAEEDDVQAHAVAHSTISLGWPNACS
jgi:hypothetical protein